MGQYKIRHALASWVDETTGQQVGHTAFRGQIAEIPEDEATRLKAYGAIIGADEELPRPGNIAELSPSPTDEELIAWLSAANTDEVVSLVAERPELRPRIDGALENVTQAQGAEAVHLEEVRRAMAGMPPVSHDEDIIIDVKGAPTGGQTDVLGGNTPATGADDTTPNPDDVNEDIIIDKGESFAVPVDSGALDGDSVETNTPLEEAPVAPPSNVDYAALVTGPADGVASYIATHPAEADAVLAAETQATNGAPRAPIVLAARSAAQFNPSGN